MNQSNHNTGYSNTNNISSSMSHNHSNCLSLQPQLNPPNNFNNNQQSMVNTGGNQTNSFPSVSQNMHSMPPGNSKINSTNNNNTYNNNNNYYYSNVNQGINISNIIPNTNIHLPNNNNNNYASTGMNFHISSSPLKASDSQEGYINKDKYSSQHKLKRLLREFGIQQYLRVSIFWDLIFIYILHSNNKFILFNF